MKKFYRLSTDQKKVRIIFLIALFFGIAAQALYIMDNLQKGFQFDLTLFGGSFIIGLACAVGVFFAITVALMQKDKSVL